MQPNPLPPPADDATTIVGTGTVTVPGSDHASNDTTNVRIVIVALAVIVLAAMVATCVLVLSGVTVPDTVYAYLGGVGTTALGGLGAMLASTASKRT